MNKQNQSAEAHFFVSQATDNEVRGIAAASNRSVSAVYRDLVEKGLMAGGYRSGSEDLAGLLKTVVSESLKPHTDRLAAISAKAAQIGAAAFFMNYYQGRQGVPDYLLEEYNETAATARKLGVEYLKLSKDKDLDSFIHRGLERMEDNT